MTTKRRLLDPAFLVAMLGLLMIVPATAGATEVWSGRTYGFSKAPYADFTQPQNQDQITPLVWITRKNIEGIFNIEQESAYASYFSPKDTEWSDGDAVNHASLTFQDWQDWNVGNPPAKVGVNACVHLISEDIYLDIVFTAWGIGSTSGGSFSYLRALPPPVPTNAQTWGRIKALYR